MTVVSKNGDTDYSGTVLFNSKFIEGAKTTNTSQTLFFYRRMDSHNVPDKYIVSDALSTVVGVYAAPATGKSTSYQETFAICSFRDELNNSSSDTTNQVINLDDIVKGISLPSDTTQSILWIQEGPNKVEKYLVDKFLKALSDLSLTGTTTTYE